MAIQYFCQNEQRKNKVREHEKYNGIDYLEVADAEQRSLLVRFLKPDNVGALTADNVRIEGGERIRNIRVNDVVPDGDDTSGQAIVVHVEQAGDFSPYTLRLVQGPGYDAPPEWVDPILCRVDFSFKVACPSEFDCKCETKCPSDAPSEPEIDYLAKDYGSFRRLMLDRLSVIIPQWKERNAADIGVAAVETLAYAADRLSYYQDAVATEAYLGTARKRVSVRRHARLLDYAMHDGCNARVWAVMDWTGGEKYELCAHTPLMTGAALPPEARVEACTVPGMTTSSQRQGISIANLSGERLVFETMHALTLREAHNRIEFYTWGDKDCCLPRGATRASLKNKDGALSNIAKGDILLFEEVAGLNSGLKEDADVSHRHVVRLTGLETAFDPLYEQQVLNIEWAPEDALPFALCLHDVKIMDEQTGEVKPGPVGVARANVVLADHGQTFYNEDLAPKTPPGEGKYSPRLRRTNITYKTLYHDESARTQPAGSLLLQDPRKAVADVDLRGNDEPWIVRHDLLESDRFATEFVVETEDDGRAYLRFGDNILGKRPAPGVKFRATYRVGNGSAGNVGAETINQVILLPGDDNQAFIRVRNPLPAQGGTEPESIEQVRLYAPQAFRVQERAVTPADFADMAQRHPEVQKAVAYRRWTGSWHTVFITVDRRGGRPVDEAFERELRTFLESFRMMGHDIEIEAPSLAALDIALRVCVGPEVQRAGVKAALQEAFSNGISTDGRRGVFHPDNFTFGQHVYLSLVVAEAMKVRGVVWVAADRFQRWGRPALGEKEKGVIKMDSREIVRLDNDRNAPENGRIEFILQGGL